MPLITLVAACGMLAACGGGGGGSSSPQSSSVSVQPSGAASAAEPAASAASAPEPASSSTITADTAASGAAPSSTKAGTTTTPTTATAATQTDTSKSATTTPSATTTIVTNGTTTTPATTVAQDSGTTTKAAGTTGNSDAGTASTGKTESIASTATRTTSKVQLTGVGLQQTLAEACTPVVGGDFVDNAIWHTRHLQPTDCAVLRTSTPQFSWTQPGDRDTSIPWTFTLRKSGSTSALKTLQTASPRVSMTSPTLAAGKYEWDVTYTTLVSKRVVKSNVRRFEVSGTGLIAWPAGTTLATRAAQKARPRMLPSGSTFASIQAATSGDYKNAYTGLINTALLAKTAADLTEPTSTRAAYSSDAAYNASVNATKNNLVLERRRIEALGLMWRFTGDSSYLTPGIARLMALTTWDPAGLTSEASQDQSNREIYLALAQGLDLYSGKLTAAQIKTIVTVLKNRIDQARGSLTAFDTYPYNPHPLNSLQYIIEALLYAVGTADFPEANAWLADGFDTFLNTITTFQTEDGGFGNGVTYGWYTMTRLPYTMAALRIMADVDMTSHPAVGQFGNFLIAFTAPNGSHMANFGDEGYATNDYQLYAWESFRLYAAVTRNPVYEWYWRAAPDNVTKTAYPGAWPLMILGLGMGGNTSGTKPSSNSSFYADAGMAALHSNASDPARSSLYFRSSRFGSFNHSHADQNSFTFVSGGKSLLISGGYYPYYMSPHHATVNRATRYKNALTFDGGIGQAEPVTAPTAPGKPVESMDARGNLTNAFDDGNWAIASGDATLAYRGYDSTKKTWTPLLDGALRTVAYHRAAKVAVIYDWASNASKARRWELNFNAINAFSVESSTAKIVNGSASACINIYGPAGSYATTKGFAVAPETANPDQYQLRYSVNTPSNQLVSVTVIREDCRSVPVTVNFNGTTATVGITGAAALAFDRGTVTVQ